MQTKLKPSAKPSLPEIPPTYAVIRHPPSSDPDRVAIRIDGVTYLIPAHQAEAFKARYGAPNRDKDWIHLKPGGRGLCL